MEKSSTLLKKYCVYFENFFVCTIEKNTLMYNTVGGIMCPHAQNVGGRADVLQVDLDYKETDLVISLCGTTEISVKNFNQN